MNRKDDGHGADCRCETCFWDNFSLAKDLDARERLADLDGQATSLKYKLGGKTVTGHKLDLPETDKEAPGRVRQWRIREANAKNRDQIQRDKRATEKLRQTMRFEASPLSVEAQYQRVDNHFGHFEYSTELRECYRCSVCEMPVRFIGSPKNNLTNCYSEKCKGRLVSIVASVESVTVGKRKVQMTQTHSMLRVRCKPVACDKCIAKKRKCKHGAKHWLSRRKSAKVLQIVRRAKVSDAETLLANLECPECQTLGAEVATYRSF